MGPAFAFTSDRHLTPRQAECVALAVEGLSSKQIARQLGIAPSTVDNHLATVMHQLNLPNRAALGLAFRDQKRDDPHILAGFPAARELQCQCGRPVAASECSNIRCTACRHDPKSRRLINSFLLVAQLNLLVALVVVAIVFHFFRAVP